MFFRQTLSAVLFLVLTAALPAHPDQTPTGDNAELLEREITTNEKSLEAAQVRLKKIETETKVYHDLLAGKPDPTLRKKLLASTREELAKTEKRHHDLSDLAKYYNAEIDRNNKNAKMWSQELRDYSEEIPRLEAKIKQLQVAEEWLNSGHGKAPPEVGETPMIKSIFRQEKDAQASVKTAENKIAELKKQVPALKKESSPAP